MLSFWLRGVEKPHRFGLHRVPPRQRDVGQPQSDPPLVGFSFSPNLSEWAGREPDADLRRLLTETHPDLVRLPIYWDAVQSSPGVLDFTSIDELLEVVAEHNKTSGDPTRVVLTIGARNFLYPELH